MPYTKKIVCLANSRKHNGYCFVGKEVLNNGLGDEFGAWVRPISPRDSEEISMEEQTFSNGTRPKLLEVVAVPFIQPKPVLHQQENHLIYAKNGNRLWENIGCVAQRELPQLLDNVSGNLWLNGCSSVHGHNDRVSVTEAKDLRNSLLLIQPASLTIHLQKNPYQESNYPKVRAEFEYNGQNYILMVTDPPTEQKYRNKNLREKEPLPCYYSVVTDNVYLCVSLGKEFQGYCYKLVASIIGDKD